MKRTTKKSSVVSHNVLRQAERRLHIAADAAGNYDHSVIIGGERSEALRLFLSDHLAGVYATAKGEAIDYRDRRTGEIDFCVYDRAAAAPIQETASNALSPAEALYAVVEVKSILTRDEILKCFGAAKKLRELRPFKRQFVPTPKRGMQPEGSRCLYIVFAYSSNLSLAGWAQKEFNRMKECAGEMGCDLDLIDRIVVLDRGMITPQSSEANLRDETNRLFLDFYIHLVNFLTRERRRREVIDWTAYTSRPHTIRLS